MSMKRMPLPLIICERGETRGAPERLPAVLANPAFGALRDSRLASGSGSAEAEQLTLELCEILQRWVSHP